ncbi:MULTISPECIES: GNAT family N-acetyltransferase [Flagellimonas]|uniref:GNAT family N-acetyltransferase n=1 Tax=Flagellimonas hadalis TaxID=2597517 RepID=A0A5N5J0X3_9FLAO|nr:GNAT family N-acetyltransferase [Allomuricauda hadalis]KAB5492066.1 GNAT family N-acetyltransferase [Allomuricauda hadalis]RUA12508.1 MAG: MarR family transcriptional regulator [Flavobacteriia bacterium]
MTEPNTLSIVPYSDIHKDAFKALNEAWITKYFKMEKMDYASLDHPKEYILDKGGYIAVAVLDSQAVGVCALIPSQKEGYDFELAKMGVSEHVQGMGIGKLLGQHIIEKATEMGAKKLYLESNRVLGPALSLYQKLGFKEMVGATSPYERSDIQMELDLRSSDESSLS